MALIEPGTVYFHPSTGELKQKDPLPAAVRDRADLNKRYFEFCLREDGGRSSCECLVDAMDTTSRTAITDDELQAVLAMAGLAPLPPDPALETLDDARYAVLAGAVKCSEEAELQG